MKFQTKNLKYFMLNIALSKRTNKTVLLSGKMCEKLIILCTGKLILIVFWVKKYLLSVRNNRKNILKVCDHISS